MEQTPARLRAVAFAVVLCGYAATSSPLGGQRAASADARVPASQAPAFAATLIGDETAEEPFRGAAVAVDADLRKILAATLVGGSGDEGDCSVALGPQGDIYLAGSTTSTDFPPGAAVLHGGSGDGKSRTFVARISRDLSRLLSAAVLSRESAPRAAATTVAFDRRRERVLVGGITASPAFPVTPGAFQTRMGSDQGAKYVAILDPRLTRLVASTLLGGTAREGVVNGLLTDSAGNVIVGGSTFSPDYPTTERAFKRTVGPGPLHHAVSGNLRQTVKALSDQGADPAIRDAKGKSALDLAQEAGMAPIIELLKGAVKLPQARAQEGFDAVNAKDLPRVEELVAADPHLLRARDGDGRTLLHRACQGFHLAMVQYLLGRGADVNARDDEGTAPLHILASGAHEAGVALLIANKADVNAADARGDTPLIFAAQAGSLSVVRLLIDRGAAAAGASRFGYTPLLRAIESNSLDIVELLIARGADPNRVFREAYYGDTPLSFAIKSGRLDMVRSLHAKGADLHYRTRLGASLLHFAAAANRAEIAAYLIDGGVGVDSVQNGGLTPLHLAAITGGLDAARLLVDRGALLDVRSKDGGTPLHFAVASRNTIIADFLRRSGATEAPRAFPRFAGRYLGQQVPGADPEPFVPELFRDIYRSYSAMIFSPDGKEVFWTGYFMPGVGYQRIWWMREVNGIWTAPELAPFSDFKSWQPMLSPDGGKIYFASDRPKAGETSSRVDLWYAAKDEAGSWGPAEHLGSPPNRDAYNEMLPSPAGDGTIYFKAFGPGSRGTGTYKSKLVNGVYQDPISIDDLIDADGRDDCAGKEHLITYAFDDPRGVMISIAFHRPDGGWTRPVHMGDLVHRGQGTIDGRVSPDGRAFFFVQNITPYWVDASFIGRLRQEALETGR